MGAPSIYTDELADKICEKISTSSIGMEHICKDIGIGYTTVTAWISKAGHPFQEKYARAKLAQMSFLADEIVEIADDARNDYMTRQMGDGIEVEVPNMELINRSRLRVDTRKWLMSKIAPKVYGEALKLQGDAENPLISTVIYLPKKGSFDQADQQINDEDFL